MSQENLKLVERYFAAGMALMDRAAASTGSRAAAVDLPEALTFFTKYWHPQAVYDVSRRIDGGVYRAAGVQQAIRDWLVAWKDFVFEPKEFLPAGDRVVVVQDFRGTTRNNMRLELQDVCAVITVADGQLVHYEEYLGRAATLEAVGLRE